MEKLGRCAFLLMIFCLFGKGNANNKKLLNSHNVYNLNTQLVAKNSQIEIPENLKYQINSTDEVLDITTDNSGNYIITGYFSTRASFGNVIFNSYGNEDIFIAKYDKNGKCKWAVQAGGPGYDKANSINTDKEGNIIITGVYYYEAKFENSTVQALGNSDIFVAKYDKEGKLNWVKSFKGKDNRNEATVVTTNANGDIYFGGNFFDNLSFGNSQIISDSAFAARKYSNVFLASLDKGGKFRWAKGLFGINLDSYLRVENGLTCDKKGNVYITGGLSGTAIFDTSRVISKGLGNQDIFIASCSHEGKWKWIKVNEKDEEKHMKGLRSDIPSNPHYVKFFSADLKVNFMKEYLLKNTNDRPNYFFNKSFMKQDWQWNSKPNPNPYSS